MSSKIFQDTGQYDIQLRMLNQQPRQTEANFLH